MMAAKLFILLGLFSCSLTAVAQTAGDSLLSIISRQKEDSNELKALIEKAVMMKDRDSALKYAGLGEKLAKNLKDEKREADCLFIRGANQTDNLRAIQDLVDALNRYEKLGDSTGMSLAQLLLQGTYRDEGDYRNALYYAFSGVKIAGPNQLKGRFGVFTDIRLAPLFLAEIGQTYILMNKLDSAMEYTQQSIDQHELFNGVDWAFPIYLLAYIQNLKGLYNEALANYRLSRILTVKNDLPRDTFQIYSGMSRLFINMGMPDSAVQYARIVAESWNPDSSERKNILEAVQSLQDVFRQKNNKDSLLKYVVLEYTLKDSFYSREKDREIQSIMFNDRLSKEELLSAQEKYKSKIQLYGLAAGLFALLVIISLLWRSNQNKQKSKAKIEKAYTELKATQAQLLQSEKMASLGELTAGIAHEIQNPLNFVNNFSDVNRELLEEMKLELDRGNIQSAKEIAGDLMSNEEKVNQHGKRADAIVKGMLLHSRANTGITEPTDINILADEYLRLSYHGLRAKEKLFSVNLKTDFDENIGKINVVPQDIGRVLLNLFNNAFYEVTEKKKQTLVDYEPQVSIQTRKNQNSIRISIKDNGNGIDGKLLDKIFQPFFTTKPPGQGTGLGLSLSYDMIHAHGGEIKVESEPGRGTVFIIELPIVG